MTRISASDVEGQWRGAGLVELASGVDALYLSGEAPLDDELVGELERARSEAEEASAPVPFSFGGRPWSMEPHAFGRYRYWLSHPYGQIGLTPRSKLPPVRAQPRAEFLHGAGPAAAVRWFVDLLEAQCGFVRLSVSRLDLHADLQGWELHGDLRHRFVCRATERVTFESSGAFSGFQFGKRATKGVSARVYDKVAEALKTGNDYWFGIWGERYVQGQPVVRVEFELNRKALHDYGLTQPDEVLAATGALWADLTNNWLSYRLPNADNTRSRWPVAPEWQDVRRAGLAERAFGVERAYEEKRRGSLRLLAPGLVGYLASFAALTGQRSFEALAPSLERFVERYEGLTGVTFPARVEEKVHKLALP